MEKETLMSVMSMLILEMTEELIEETRKEPTEELKKHLDALRYFSEHSNSILSKVLTGSTIKQEYENAILFHTKKFVTKLKRIEKTKK